MDLITTRKAGKAETGPSNKRPTLPLQLTARASAPTSALKKARTGGSTGGSLGGKEGRPGLDKVTPSAEDHACGLGGELPFDGEFTFGSWASSRLVCLSPIRPLAKGHFLYRTLHLSRDDALSMPTALFPLPLPNALPAGMRARKQSGRAWKRLRLSRLLHVMVMCLNFLHAGMRPVPTSCLRRPPSDTQVSLQRLSGFIKACGRQAGTVPVLH